MWLFIYIHVGDLVLRHGKNRKSHALPPPSAIKIKMMNPSGTAIVDFQLLENPLFIHFLGKPLLALIFLRPCLCSLLCDTLGVGHCSNLDLLVEWFPMILMRWQFSFVVCFVVQFVGSRKSIHLNFNYTSHCRSKISFWLCCGIFYGCRVLPHFSSWHTPVSAVSACCNLNQSSYYLHS